MLEELARTREVVIFDNILAGLTGWLGGRAGIAAQHAVIPAQPRQAQSAARCGALLSHGGRARSAVLESR